MYKCNKCGSFDVDYKRFVSDNELGYVDNLYCYECGEIFGVSDISKILIKNSLFVANKKIGDVNE